MDVPPDLLREISGRLHDAADFVRFHAVCRPWRDSRSGDVPRFLPWLLSANNKDNESIMIRCVFSKTSYSAPPPAHRRSWVASADGTAVRYFTAGPCYGLLHDPLTGAHTLPLPPFPHRSGGDQWEQKEDVNDIVYGDGTILLFSESSHNMFRVALLRPGDTAWTLVDRNLPFDYGEFCIVYHGGKIMFTVEPNEWHVTAAENGVVEDDVLVPTTLLPHEDEDYIYYRSYALQTRGELLWVSVQIPHRVCSCLPCGLRVVVLALTEGPEKSSWLRKDGRSLADRVLFLGWPNSFAVEASHELGGDGGCAYFFYNDDDAFPPDQLGVFRYNLIDEKPELVEWLPQGWHNESCTWLIPHPAIAPIQVQAPKRKQRTTGTRRIIQVLHALFRCVNLWLTANSATFVSR